MANGVLRVRVTATEILITRGAESASVPNNCNPYALIEDVDNRLDAMPALSLSGAMEKAYAQLCGKPKPVP
jgi:uncharacterized membrane protein YjjP (DUF1212 family)